MIVEHTLTFSDGMVHMSLDEFMTLVTELQELGVTAIAQVVGDGIVNLRLTPLGRDQ